MVSEFGTVMGFTDFDPEKIDVSEIKELTDSIPKDGNVDTAIAEVMATRFLRGADRCAEFISTLTWWAAKTEDQKRHAFSQAFIVKAVQKGLKTAAEKKAYAEGEEEYLKACETSNRAKAMKQWFQNKHESLISAHYLMKDIAKGGRSHQRAGGQTDNTWGEQDWK
jgi:hypothetical protein